MARPPTNTDRAAAESTATRSHEGTATICFDEEFIERLANGELDEASRLEFDSHCAGCAECGRRFDEVRLNLGAVEAVRAAAWSPLDGVPPEPSIDGYRILRQLGRGGMGRVYLAEQIRPARLVAIKVMEPFRDSRLLDREVEILARLSHPGIASIHEAGRTSDGRSYFAMEFVDGEDLLTHARGRPLRERLALLRDAVAAVAYAHRLGVIHRDVKPGNILVTRAPEEGRWTPKVLDFGLATIRASAGAADGSLIGWSGHVFGTIPYMSPEQSRGEPADTRSDVHALGSIAFELVTGRPILELGARTMHEALAARASLRAPRLRSISPETPPDLDAIVAKALEFEPADRYDGAGAFAEDLSRWLAGQAVAARAPTALEQARRLIRRQPIASALAAALLVSIAAFAAIMTVLAANLAERHQAAISAQSTSRERLDALVSQTTLLLDELLDAMADDLGGDATRSEIVEEVARYYDSLLEADPDEPRLQRAQMGVLRTLSALSRQRGDAERARSLMERSHELAARVLTARTIDPDEKFQWGYSLMYLAAALRESDREASDRLDDEATRVFEELAASTPDVEIHLAQLAAMLKRKANRALSAGDRDSARSHLTRALELRQRTLELEPESIAALEGALVARYSLAHFELGGQDAERAVATLVETLAQVDDALAIHSARRRLLELRAQIHLDLAGAMRNSGQPQSAQDHAFAAFRDLDRIVTADPQILRCRMQRSAACGMLADLAREAGDLAAAAEWEARSR
ncbi:MAG: serine/threonine protein kinase [Phycisphaerae bacterium]|nr:serine/threonine protein kinase [Phycisphaerae bacterium]